MPRVGPREFFDSWREQLIRASALVEATIDFADEEGVEAEARSEIGPIIGSLTNELGNVLKDGRRGQMVRDGVRVALVGPPNVREVELAECFGGAGHCNRDCRGRHDP